MLKQEAEWIGRFLRTVPDETLFPIVNVGSQTAEFRAKVQPWIDDLVFDPLCARGGQVIHTDLQAARGVDITGDLMDPGFRDELRRLGARSVLCCNLLEHVTDRAAITASLQDLVAPRSVAVLSVPFRFPYHADPIDTMYRPQPAELAALFPGFQISAAEIVRCQTWLTYLCARSLASPASVVRDVLGGRGRSSAENAPPDAESLWAWSFRRFEVTCVGLINPG